MPKYRVTADGEGRGFEPFRRVVSVDAEDFNHVPEQLPDSLVPVPEDGTIDILRLEIRRLGDARGAA